MFFVSFFLNLAISGTLFSTCFENESEVGQIGEHHCVMYDIKTCVGFIVLLLSICFLSLETMVVNAKGNYFNSHSENV